MDGELILVTHHHLEVEVVEGVADQPPEVPIIAVLPPRDKEVDKTHLMEQVAVCIAIVDRQPKETKVEC